MPEIVVLALYSLMLAIILVFALIQLHLSVRYLKARRGTGPASLPLDEATLPRVTVQLPIYNELYVVERLLDSIARLDYPHHLLDIQVLDDSTDETTAIVAAKVASLAATGLPISLVHRENREGFKAGALKEGMAKTDGEFIAIFDADFVPEPDFLRQTLPYFANDKVAAVQTKWAHLNEDQSLLTRVYAFMLNAHFTIEQRGRSSSGYFINFNGTAGVWRREAIEDAGGWRADTLTEDIDLSYRAQLRGWRLVYLEDVVSPAELPADMPGIRSQQRRWIKGGAENARLHLGNISRAKLPPLRRLHACAHLIGSSLYMVVVTAILASVALTFLKGTGIATDYMQFGTPFVIATLCIAWVYYLAQGWGTYSGLGLFRYVGLLLLFLVFTLGLSIQCSRAALEGWLGRKSEFVRTPKHGSGNGGGIHWTKNRYVARRVDRDVLIETGVALLLIAAIAYGSWHGDFGLIPLQVMALSGLSWVIGLSLWHTRLRRRQAAAPESQQLAEERSGS